MAIQKPDPEKVEAFQRALRADEEAARRHWPNPNKNVHHTIRLLEGEAELLRYRGKTYRVPLLSGRDGLHMLDLAAQMDKAGRAGNVEDFDTLAALLRELFGKAARPLGWRGRVWDWLPNPFRNATTAEVRYLLRFFQAVPDEMPRRILIDPQGGPPPPVDFLELIYTFANRYTFLLDEKGFPRYWRSFMLGIHLLNREDAREALRMAQAMGVGDLEPREKQEWYRRMEAAAGW
jgi:hypothetical protein